MNSVNARTMLALAVLSCLVAGSGTTWSQGSAPAGSDNLALAVANAQKANQAALARYSWKVKTTLSREGGAQANSVTEMRFNDAGKIDATNLSSDSNVEQKPGLRGREQDKKLEEFAAYVEKVVKHSSQYIFLSKGEMVDMFDKAKITKGDGGTDVAAGDLFVKGDALNMTVDSATNLTKKLSFSTMLDQDAITGMVTFAQIMNGPNRPTSYEIDVPGKALKISGETFDWIEQK